MAEQSAKGVVVRWVAAGLLLVLAGVIFYFATGVLEGYDQPGSDQFTFTQPALPDDGSFKPRQPRDVIVKTERLPDGTIVEHIERRHVPVPDGDAQLLGVPLPQPQADVPEPAGIKPPENATNLLRYASPEDPPYELTSVWSIADAKVSDVASYYQTAAGDRGFDLLRNTLSADESVRRMVFEAKRRLLTIRCRQVGPVVRVVIQLRYTTALGSD